jgi:hypothetical protein
VSEFNAIGLALTDLLPHLFYIRAVALVVGVTILVHAFCMAGFVPPDRTPWDVAIPLALTGGAAAGLIFGAIAGNIEAMFYSSLAATICWGSMALVLWLRGLHVSRHLQASEGP